MTATPGPQLLPIAIGSYADPGYPALAADAEVDRIVKLLSDFYPDVLPWDVPPADRGVDAVNARLVAWSGQPDRSNTILYWVGHGWSNDVTAALATRFSPANEAAAAISPADLATHLSRRPAEGTGWTFAIFDACRSTRFVELLAAHLLQDPTSAGRVLLFGVSGEGITRLGRFRTALARSLNNTFKGITDISLRELGHELARDLGGTTIEIRLRDGWLTRHAPVPPRATPLDVAADLRRVLATLTTNEQRHFVPKGQGAEQGELAWYFQGRQDEQRQISEWLRSHDTGMLVVTGRPGSGKSALLGQVLTQSRPLLRHTLARHDLLPEAPVGQRPDDDAFDTTVQLTGLAPADVVRAIAADTGLGEPPASHSIATQTDWLIEQTRAAGRPLTLLVDALDEAQQPITIADRLLRRLATIPGVRVVAGTRSSTHEGPDLPQPPDTDLLDALGRGQDQVIVHREPAAIARYVRRRLARALPDLDPDTIADLAVDIAAREDNEFLFARLAVHEILARPELLTTHTGQLRQLLAGDHRSLFAAALTRLADLASTNLALLRGLAFARGRGAPIRGGIWETIATGLAPDFYATPEQIGSLLDAAAPYLMYDVEDGQTVYRLAHRTFQEHFLEELGEQAVTGGHHQVLVALLALITDDRPLNSYLARHLSGHTVEAGVHGWHTLASRVDVLDLLDQTALGADAMRGAFGHADLPSHIAGVIGARHHLATAAPENRHSLRQIAIARHTAARSFPRPQRIHMRANWWVRTAVLRQHRLHATLTGHTGHTGRIRTVVALPSTDGQTLLATGSSDGTVQLWDPIAGLPVGDPLVGHTSPETEVAVNAVAPFTSPEGQMLLVICNSDRTVQVWDPIAGVPVGDPLVGHTSPAAGVKVAAFSGPKGQALLAIGNSDGTVQVWDPNTGLPVGKPLVGHTEVVRAVVTFPSSDGRTLLASGSLDGTVRVWDPNTGVLVGDPLIGHGSRVWALTAFSGPEGQALLAIGNNDGTVQMWDPNTGVPVGDLMVGHTVYAVTAFAGPEGRMLLATGSGNRAVRVWDPIAGTPVGAPLTGHTREVSAVTAFAGPEGRMLLATGGAEGTVRVWDPTADTSVGDPPFGHINAVQAVAAFTGSSGRMLLATGSGDGAVRVWDATTGAPIGGPLIGHTDVARAMATFRSSRGRTLLASGSWDGTVRVWDPIAGTPVGGPLTGHTGWVMALVAFTGSEGRTLLAFGTLGGGVRVWDPTTGFTAGAPFAGHADVEALVAFAGSDGRMLLAAGGTRTVRVWDPTTGTPVGAPLSGHTGSVKALVAFAGSDGRMLLASGSSDRTVRVWDPTIGTPIGDPLKGHTDSVAAVAAFAGSDGCTLLASGSQDGTVRVWDLATGRHMHLIPVDSPVSSLSVIDGGIAVGCDDGLLVIDLAL
jgi:WD40 repeat protein